MRLALIQALRLGGLILVDFSPRRPNQHASGPKSLFLPADFRLQVTPRVCGGFP
jgi:hypothetical protein